MNRFDQRTQEFSWKIERRYNIGLDACGELAASPARLALLLSGADLRFIAPIFGDVRRFSNGAAKSICLDGCPARQRTGDPPGAVSAERRRTRRALQNG